jgi:hypothetical protein
MLAFFFFGGASVPERLAPGPESVLAHTFRVAQDSGIILGKAKIVVSIMSVHDHGDFPATEIGGHLPDGREGAVLI